MFFRFLKPAAAHPGIKLDVIENERTSAWTSVSSTLFPSAAF